MDEQARRENGERITRMLREGQPLDRIFPPKRLWTPAPEVFEDGHADFVATTVPSPHGGTEIRYYLWDCRHTRSQLELAGYTEDQDGEVLAKMQGNARHVAAIGGHVCLCWPKGWAAA